MAFGPFSSESRASDSRTGGGDNSIVVGSKAALGTFSYNAPFNVGRGSAVATPEPSFIDRFVDAESGVSPWLIVGGFGLLIVILPWLIKRLR